MTDTLGAAESGTDPHDHSDHDHPPTGADLVLELVRGLSVLALVIPVLAVLLLVAILPVAPSSPLVLVLGLALGSSHLISLVLTSLFVAKTRKQLAVNPGLLVARSAIEEALRLAAALAVVVLWPLDAAGPLGIWLGAGAALVWMALTTAQTVSTRRRIARPSEWSKEAIETLLTQRVTVRSTIVMRVLDLLGTVGFQIGATLLLVQAPVLVIATLVLSIGSGLSTLVLQRKPPAERAASAWSYAPLGIGILALAMGLLGLLA